MGQTADHDILQQSTLSYYRDNLNAFVADTLTADMSYARDRFLRSLQASSAPRILDFGCGSGRDTKAFLDLGYAVDAADGSEELCRSASEFTGIHVRHMLFQELDAEAYYDGIWACASILHLPKEELSDVLRRIAAALKQNGVLYTSFKYGNYEGMRDGRYYTDFTEASLAAFWTDCRLERDYSLQIFETWITEDVRPGRKEERWLNLLARRASK